MIIHSHNLRFFPDSNSVHRMGKIAPDFYIPRVKYVYELDLYTFDECSDHGNYLLGRAVQGLKNAIVDALEERVYNEANLAATFWVSRQRVSDSIATDPIYIASVEDLEEWIDFEELAERYEECFSLEDLINETGFMRSVNVYIWRESTFKVEPLLHVENSQIWYPDQQQKWFLWDNGERVECGSFSCFDEKGGKVKLSRKNILKDGDRTMVEYGGEQHAQAELFYLLEHMLAKIVGHRSDCISVKSIKFELHDKPGEKKEPLKAVPRSSEEWVPRKINRNPSRKSKK